MRRIPVIAVVAGAVAVVVPWSPGFLLHNDSVAVPEQALLPWMWGAGTAPPRSVPQDAVVAVLDSLVPGWLLQRLMVAGALVLLGCGVAHLLKDRSRLERSCAAIVAIWSTYVFERMAMGHWGQLLGVAALPWVLAATADARERVPGAAAKAVAWVALGSLAPSTGALLLAAVVVVVGWPGPRDTRRSAVVLLAALALQLVWIVPGVQHPGSPTAAAADVFGLRSEGLAGPLLTAFTTGGIWSANAAPPTREGVMSVVAAVVLGVAAAAGLGRVRGMRRTVLGPLVVLAAAGFTWALLTAVPSAQGLVLGVESWPGGGLLRDAQKWLAPWLVLLALAAGCGLARMARAVPGVDARWPAATLAVLIPVVLLPDLAFGMWGRLTPVQYPAEWAAVRSLRSASDRPGDVVSWPWSAFRAYGWNDARTSLDPAPRYLPRTVVTDSRLLVQHQDELVVVPSDDPRSIEVGEALMGPDAAGRLADLGVGWLLVQVGQPASPGYPVALPAELEAASTQVLRSATLELRTLSPPAAAPAPGQVLAVLVAWVAWTATLLAAVVALARHSWPRQPPGTRAGSDPPATLPGTERR